MLKTENTLLTGPVGPALLRFALPFFAASFLQLLYGAVDMAAVERFLRSPLAAEMRVAPRLWREYRFSLLVDGGDYLGGDARGEELLLQGVVDCFFEAEDGLVVVDFKTDRVEREVQARRTEAYRPQVLAYSDALEKIFQKKVCRRVLYYFHTGDTVEL